MKIPHKAAPKNPHFSAAIFHVDSDIAYIYIYILVMSRPQKCPSLLGGTSTVRWKIRKRSYSNDKGTIWGEEVKSNGYVVFFLMRVLVGGNNIQNTNKNSRFPDFLIDRFGQILTERIATTNSYDSLSGGSRRENLLEMVPALAKKKGRQKTGDMSILMWDEELYETMVTYTWSSRDQWRWVCGQKHEWMNANLCMYIV